MPYLLRIFDRLKTIHDAKVWTLSLKLKIFEKIFYPFWFVASYNNLYIHFIGILLFFLTTEIMRCYLKQDFEYINWITSRILAILILIFTLTMMIFET